ncbi:putative invasin [Xenorhabdus stockiae]|uniref:Putative invasin n=1 Tax=Xenorhabdus stockiae TaxID=351614 RepID=A0A2D0KW49_9GAMM|nr:inverse autotransporter beta domain-containing protein [Xenorhabdus stockiae]PHM67676.1 putative invasin [Xenorhabdus stockiae]
MQSYASKIIVFFVLLYMLLMPSTLSNASVEENIKYEEFYTHAQKNNDTLETDMPNVLFSNIQTVNHVLSSSYSELTEQAEYFALDKLNSTVSSKAQKWLSQFGAVKINLGLDREWTLKNNSIDILLPIYDNKVDWLLFSQLGYRNKDSRNTINLGLGGRYFDNNWMYGLNTFYDHDVTGRNQRLGLGGEIWSDYTKLSANVYHRLSDWQESRNFEDYYERPATGYDINSEFFLSAYPNLGMKLTYEQYFGDNVTLFNSETKQKNPSQAKLGLTYTPIPLVTIGVDYRQGEKGHTETQFLANLNYKFGIPLDTQLSPDNVASMRTLVGSRYDLVERNNNIILDHKKREQDEFLKMDTIIGYGQQEIPINAPIRSHANIKHIGWFVTDKKFKNNKGKLSSDSGKSIVVTLPTYQETHKSDYMLDIVFTDNQNRKKVIQVPIRVLQFLVDGKINIIPPESPKTTDSAKNGYTFSNPIITYEGLPAGEFVKNATIDKVIWSTVPALGNESGLRFEWNNKQAKTNENGELTILTDEKEQLIPNILFSEKPYDNVKIYIQLDGAPKQEIGSVSFSPYHIRDGLTVNPKSPLIVGDEKSYTFSATVVDRQGNPLIKQSIKDVIWKAIDDKGKSVKLTTEADSTNDSGELIATLDSSKPLSGVKVSLSIKNQAAVTADPVSIKSEKDNIDVVCEATSGERPVLVSETYTCKATVSDENSKGVAGKIVNWSVKGSSNLRFTHSQSETDRNGIAKTTLTSSTEVSNTDVAIIASVAHHGQGESKGSINFIWPEISIEPSPVKGRQDQYSLTATVWREKDNTVYKGQGIKFSWTKPQLKDGSDAPSYVELSTRQGTPLPSIPQQVNPNNGTLTAEITSHEAVQVKACMNIEGKNHASPTCSAMMNIVPPEYEIASVELIGSKKILMGNGQEEFHYKAKIINKNDKEKIISYQVIQGVQWMHDHEKIPKERFPQPEAYSPTNKDKFTTDQDGYLYARLKSRVGVENVKVSLKISDAPQVETNNENEVAFTPVTLPAVLYIYDEYTDKNKYFDNKDGKRHPNNIFSSLRGELRESEISGSFDKDENKITYGISDVNSPIFGTNMLSFGTGSGPIEFIAPGSATITVKITKQTGEIQLYEYKMSAIKMLELPADGYKNVTGDIHCNTGSVANKIPKLFLDKDVSDSANIYSLYNEFGNLYNWGVFRDITKVEGDTIVVESSDPSTNGEFRIYDFDKNTFDNKSKGIVLCYIQV